MRWLLIKDLQILRRSPLLVAVLVIYPVVVAVLIGLALSRGPDRPAGRVRQRGARGGEARDRWTRGSTCSAPRSSSTSASTRSTSPHASEAIEKVRSGEALAAVIVSRVTPCASSRRQFERPHVEVFVNEEDPLKARLVDDTITSLVATANQRLSRAFTSVLLELPRPAPARRAR